MKSIREWLEEKGIKLETSVQDAMVAVRNDRSELGAAAWEGEQDVIAALKLAAKNSKYASSLGGMLNRLAMMIAQEDEELSKRVKATGMKFLRAERSVGNDDAVVREVP